MSVREILRQIKQRLVDNEGEFGYWGDRVAMKAKRDPRSLLEELRWNAIGDCQRCPLAVSRKNIVFGVGNPNARVLFVGEGPGFDEDREGEPFVGKAGQLLDKIIGAIGLDRRGVYIANIVKCHPMKEPAHPDRRGNDRAPVFEEMERCFPFLREQIRIINPRFIVALGVTAAGALLGSGPSLSRLRGRFHERDLVEGLPPFNILPTYHPAALLREDAYKRPVWEDMKLLKAELMRDAE